MGQKDIVSKRVLKSLAADMANLLLKLDIDKDSVELLSTEQQRIELRHADLVVRVCERESGAPFILHIEIQNNNHAEMPLRMMRYYTDIQLAYSGERIRQYLIYIGDDELNMPEILDAGDFRYRYHVLDMRTVDCSLLLAHDTPDALVLAVLCDFKERPTQDVVNYIVKRLHELLQDDERGFRDYFEMLETLSENRHLQANINEAKAMLTQVDVRKFASYNWGRADGREEGDYQARWNMAIQLLPLMNDERIADLTDFTVDVISALREEHEEE